MYPDTLYISAVALATLVSAAHYTCNWIPGSGKPSDDEWEFFCSAPWDTDNVYRCVENSPGGEGLKVADWDVFGPKILELGK